jgi:hypothetical protein
MVNPSPRSLEISSRNSRVSALQKRWDRLRADLDLILRQRGADMADPPGGVSGLLVRDCKGKEADKLVARIDPGVVSLVARTARPGLFNRQLSQVPSAGHWCPLQVLRPHSSPERSRPPISPRNRVRWKSPTVNLRQHGNAGCQTVPFRVHTST